MGDLLPGIYHFKIPVEIGDDETANDMVLREMKSGNVVYSPPVQEPAPIDGAHE